MATYRVLAAGLALLCSLGWCEAVGSYVLTRNVIKPLPVDDYVPIDLYVMSRCPDAIYTEGVFDEVMKIVHPIATISTHYIAQAHGPSVTCKHGDLECQGNIQQLCVAKYAPGHDGNKDFWEFVRCQDANTTHIGELALAEQCLDELPDDVAEPARQCMTSYEGAGLLLGDARRTASLGVVTSATVFVDGSKRCIRDSGVWYDCAGGSDVKDFVSAVCNTYLEKTGKWPALCGAQ